MEDECSDTGRPGADGPFSDPKLNREYRRVEANIDRPGAAAHISEFSSKNQEATDVIASAISERAEERADIIDVIGQVQLDSWDSGYNAAIKILKSMGAMVVAEELERAREDYWKTKGVDPEDD